MSDLVIKPLHETIADIERKRKAREDGRKLAASAIAKFRLMLAASAQSNNGEEA